MPISNTGFLITPSATAKAEAEQILIDTYGADVNLSESSPNGLLVQNFALALTRRENAQAETVNSMNPNVAEGIQLDAICLNSSIQRIPATFSTATCQLTGLIGTSITENSQVASTNNDVFLIDTTTVIGGGGTATCTVTSQLPGAISVAANTINKIITGISGWSTVNNTDAGNFGEPQQNDTELRLTRVDRLAEASSGSVPAIKAGATKLNPISSYVTDNKDENDIIQDGITILGKSVLLVLEGGGSDLQVATMLYQKLSGGCAMSGTHSYSLTVTDTPVPFIAKWQIATPLALGLNIVLKLGSIYPPALDDLIASIINNNFSFDVIGEFIFATDFITLLVENGISPMRSLTFNVGSNMNLTQYQMPIANSLGSSMIADDVHITYV